MQFERHFFIAVDVFTLASLLEFVICDRLQKPKSCSEIIFAQTRAGGGSEENMSKFGMNLCLVSALAIIMLPLSALAQNVAPINARIDSISPGVVKPGDEVTLKGFFGPRLEPNRGYKQVVLYDQQNQKAGYLNVDKGWGENEVVGIAPYGLKPQRYRVRICDGLIQCSNERTLRLQGADRPELGFAGPMLFGFKKREFKAQEAFYLEPHEVRVLPDGRIDVDFFYTFSEFNGRPAQGFMNTISWTPMIGRDAKILQEDKNLSLPAFGKKTIATHITLPKPDYSIVYVHLDRSKKVRETGYMENKVTAILRFKGFERPDFIIEEIKQVGSKPKVGQPVVFDVKIKNAGDARSDHATVGYRVGGSSNLESVPLLPMGPNTLRTVRITTEPFSRAQKYRITVIVNHDHRVKEKKTDNNEKYQTFTVQK